MSFLIHVRNISSGTVEYYLNVSLAVEHLEESPPAVVYLPGELPEKVQLLLGVL